MHKTKRLSFEQNRLFSSAAWLWLIGGYAVLTGCGMFAETPEDRLFARAELEPVPPLKTVGKLRLSTPKEDYSGIIWLGGSRYAVVSDKKDGYYLAELKLDAAGRPLGFVHGEFLGWKDVWRDCEAITRMPESNRVWIAAENDQRILEYASGVKTGRELQVPVVFRMATENYGFESLTYCADTRRFWTITESTLPPDGPQADGARPVGNRLRLQSFGDDLLAKEQRAYLTDAPQARDVAAMAYAFGVSELAALPDGRLLVLEREFYATKVGLGSWSHHRIYLVDPWAGEEVGGMVSLEKLSEKSFLPKTLLWELRTEFNGGNLANYEGMCLGPILPDGSRTVILINDAQGQSVLDEFVLVLQLEMPPARENRGGGK